MNDTLLAPAPADLATPASPAETQFRAAGPQGQPPRVYAPRLALYHQNGKGTGSAFTLELRPATSEKDGVMFAALAPQKTAAARNVPASFGWSEKITVKLDFSDICQMLLVLTGRAESLGEGKGLLHDGPSTRTFISLTHKTEAPWTGYLLEFSRKDKAAPDGSAARQRILLTDAEAYGLTLILQNELPHLVFGR
ncbi:MAG: hypothetical protein ILO10_01415 [Kiritimatiellae bacterium]|nr:hypothetical protein [Kiritimatiellia bacterium]